MQLLDELSTLRPYTTSRDLTPATFAPCNIIGCTHAADLACHGR
jgi:hypothetical protein